MIVLVVVKVKHRGREILFTLWDDDYIEKEIIDMFERNIPADEEETFLDLDEIINTLADDEVLSSPPKDFNLPSLEIQRSQFGEEHFTVCTRNVM